MKTNEIQFEKIAMHYNCKHFLEKEAMQSVEFISDIIVELVNTIGLYTVEKEILNFSFPTMSECRIISHSKLAQKNENETSNEEFERQIQVDAKKLFQYWKEIWFNITREYESKLNEKYGSFEKRMESKYNFSHLPITAKCKIHSYVLELTKGSLNNFKCEHHYASIVDIVTASIS